MDEERGRFLHRRMSGPQLGPMICMYVVDCLWRSKQLFNLIARCYVGTVSFPIQAEYACMTSERAVRESDRADRTGRIELLPVRDF